MSGTSDRKRSGFTLVESVVILSIISIFFVVSAPNFLGRKNTAILEDGTAILRRALELARSKSVAGADLSDHGVYINGDEMFIFEGEHFSGSGSFILLPAGLTTDQIDTEIVFKRVNANTSGNFAIQVSNSQGKYKTVFINSMGVIYSQ